MKNAAQTKNKIQSLHEDLILLADTHRQTEASLLRKLQEMDHLRGYRQYGRKSLWDYAILDLKLSTNVAGTFIQIERAAQIEPELLVAIEKGDLDVSHARIISPLLRSDDVSPTQKKEWVTRASALSKRDLEIEIRKENPEIFHRREIIRQRTESETTLSVTLTHDELQILRRAQTCLEKKRKKALTLKETLLELSAEFIEKNDALEKARRAEVRAKKENTEKNTGGGSDDKSDEKPADEASQIKSVQGPGLEVPHRSALTALSPGKVPVGGIARRPNIPAGTKHAVFQRDQGLCQWIGPDGNQCHDSKWTEIHHMSEVSRGGGDELGNLITWCSAHHKMHHAMQ